MLYTVASALYIIKLLYNSTVSMVTDAISHINISVTTDSADKQCFQLIKEHVNTNISTRYETRITCWGNLVTQGRNSHNYLLHGTKENGCT